MRGEVDLADWREYVEAQIDWDLEFDRQDERLLDFVDDGAEWRGGAR